MSKTASISSGIAARYATAVFDLAQEAGALGALEGDVQALMAALDDSADLRALLASPVISRQEQGAAIGALCKKMKLSQVLSNALQLMASKRRLFVLPQLLGDLAARIADEKGEATAEVVAAAALSKTQSAALSKVLKARAGKEVKLKITVDESLIGGLVVKLGSTMIDTSLKARLAALRNAMKEVG